MFRTKSDKGSSSASVEGLIKKATDETLTSDNWQYILEVCDRISSNPESGTNEAIKAVSERLLVKDANVTLRALSLLVAIAENCGSRMQQQIATTSFLQGCLLKRLADKKLHKTVKLRIAEVVKQLHESFKTDPSLKPMADAYHRILTEYPQYLKSQAPGPDKPAKQEISKQEKFKEEEELQRVLKLSLHEFEREQSVKKSSLNSKPLPSTEFTESTRGPTITSVNVPSNEASNQSQSIMTQNSNAASNNQEESKTIANVSKVRALYDLISYEPDELSFRKGDVISVIESVYRDWWRGSLSNGKIGIFPLNYVTPVVTKSPEELQEEQRVESQILNVESKKVNKLLALLSSNPDTINEDEITQLYNDIIPLRPALGKFIDQYCVKKEEFMALNHQLNSEIKSYNEMMDRSISTKVSHQTTSSMPPYPTGISNGVPSYPNISRDFSSNPNKLQQQPTSNGFGNAVYPHPGEPYYADVPVSTYTHQNQHIPPQYSNSSQQYPDQFSNINRFPDVNNL